MIEINVWINDYINEIKKTFADRIWFVGLQGSYSRGEATETSDVDVVVILDKLTASDINIYNSMLDSLQNRELVCGFISGKNEIFNWETSDLIHFYYDTKPLIGNLDELLSLIDREAVDRAIKIGVCNMYHTCVHNMLYEKSEEILKELYKTAIFTIQTIYFAQTGRYILKQSDLLEYVSAEDKKIVEIHFNLKNGRTFDFNDISGILFEWLINKINS